MGAMGDDFFGGWERGDAELFARFAQPAEPLAGKITDFMGIRTATSLHPWASHYDRQVLTALPIPDDSLRAEAIEYFALFDAMENAPANSFSMSEVGASYAPWTCVAAVTAKRRGKTQINLTAVEASPYLFSLISSHFAENSIDLEGVHLINGAAASERTALLFPKVNNPGENGGQISIDNTDKDYLGRTVEYESVEAYPLGDLLPQGEVDLIHMDIQGFEFDVLSNAIEILNQRVKAVFIGTHSRKIEGQLLELFHGQGWSLLRERPTRFSYTRDREDITGWTTRDGGQYWINPKLRNL